MTDSHTDNSPLTSLEKWKLAARELALEVSDRAYHGMSVLDRLTGWMVMLLCREGKDGQREEDKKGQIDIPQLVDMDHDALMARANERFRSQRSNNTDRQKLIWWELAEHMMHESFHAKTFIERYEAWVIVFLCREGRSGFIQGENAKFISLEDCMTEALEIFLAAVNPQGLDDEDMFDRQRQTARANRQAEHSMGS